MAEFLFELGVEEVPVSYIQDIMDQLENGFKAGLEEKGIGYGSLETSMTNRRFLIFVNNISEVSRSRSEQVKGPSRDISYDDSGKPAKALEKFLEANGIDESDLVESFIIWSIDVIVPLLSLDYCRPIRMAKNRTD